METVSDLFKRNSDFGGKDRPRIKICGINNLDDIEFCYRQGVDALGFLVGEEKLAADGRILGHRLSVDRAEDLVAHVPQQMSAVLLIHSTVVDDILTLCRAIRPSVIQVQMPISLEAFKSLRQALRDTKIIKTCHVRSDTDRQELISTARAFVSQGVVDGLLLDSQRPKDTGDVQTGGTGQPHNWNISASVVEAVQGVSYHAILSRFEAV